MKEHGYDKKERNGNRFYSVTWSPYIIGEKFNILKKFTEMTGVFVLFYVNKYKRLAPLAVGAAWYTGLRPTLLKYFHKMTGEFIPEFVMNKIDNDKIYIKFVEVYVLDDFLDILFSTASKYKDVFVDTNGLPCPADIANVRVMDDNTKIYYKPVKPLDI